MFNSERKDHWYAGVAGFISAVFVYVVLTISNVPLGFGVITVPRWIIIPVMPAGEILVYYLASKYFPHFSALRQFGRYTIVGLMNFMIDVGILSVLSYLSGIYGGLYIFLLNGVAGAIAITNSYYWNRTWTFTREVSPHTKEFIMFVAVTIGGWLINSTIVYFITKFINPGDNLTPERLLVVAKIGATFISVVWNFLGYKFFVFHPHTDHNLG